MSIPAVLKRVRLRLGRRACVGALALLTGVVALATGWGAGIDDSLKEVRQRLREHSASGDIAIVEIDAKSLRALSQWPLPRHYHAQLVDRLSAAQPSLIAFDVNFEVASSPRDDQALTAALARAGGLVVLPTFQQDEGVGSSDVVETLPYEPFRTNAFLGGVNIFPDEDGVIRRLPLGTVTDGLSRPSMASLLADAPGDVETLYEIDYSIDPATIPRLSFIDVMNGRVDPSRIAGKKLIVGGTSADMGDRYTVPIHGVLPGVVIQALAAETIIAGGVPATGSGWWPLLVVLGAALFALGRRRPGRRAGALALGVLTVLLLPLVGEHWFGLSFPIAPALAALVILAVGVFGLQLGDYHRARSLVDVDTRLPNQRAFLARLEPDPTVVVAAIDRFAALAAGLGPEATSLLVQRVAERLAVGGRVIHRIDEHALAWAEPNDARDALDDHLSGLATLMRTPIDCGRPVDVTLAFGVAEPCGDAKQQLANATLAADRALRRKVATLHYAEVDDETGWHLSLMAELGSAMAAGEVWNAYQPKLDIASGRIIGVETLVRWNHRERGPVGPDRFIPVVEAAGRAADLTAHVITDALKTAQGWRADGHDLSVAVNVSATLLEDRAFIVWLGETLRQSKVPPKQLIIEVTESATMKDVDKAVAALEEWRRLGVAISIDDYGTGQSSLGYLQRLPATELKIDQSFIRNAVHDSRDAIMVRSTIALAHQLGMKVVGEGVEDDATLSLLREAGCDVAQGWLIGKPVAADALRAMLARQAERAAA